MKFKATIAGSILIFWLMLALGGAAQSAGLFADQLAEKKVEAYERIHGESGIKRRPLATIYKEFADLARAESQRADWIQYGTSGSGKPLMALKVHKKNFTSVQVDLIGNQQAKGESRPAILISEGIHGNEYLHITDRLPFEFMSVNQPHTEFERFLGMGGIIYFVPVMNPDGYSAGRRENSAGADLNRDFTIQAAGNTGFRQTETKAISQFIASEVKGQNLRVEVSMEYHCCIGGLIHPWAWTSEPLTGETLERHREVGEFVSDIFNYRYGTVSDILGYSAVGGSDDYYLETYGRRAFSFEGSRGIEEQRLKEHVSLWNRIFNVL